MEEMKKMKKMIHKIDKIQKKKMHNYLLRQLTEAVAQNNFAKVSVSISMICITSSKIVVILKQIVEFFLIACQA